jgi:glycosyltransferase involved in cell wall biosynthesis
MKLPRLPARNLTIAVIGRIGFHKGANLVNALSVEVKKRELPIRIVIIGTSDEHFDSEIVTVHGYYRRDELPSILQDRGVSMVLMPSIVPETFSYVSHEVIAMNLPLVTLPLGAQAECASNYARGFVASGMRPDVLLDEILQFASRGYGDASV